MGRVKCSQVDGSKLIIWIIVSSMVENTLFFNKIFAIRTSIPLLIPNYKSLVPDINAEIILSVVIFLLVPDNFPQGPLPYNLFQQLTLLSQMGFSY